MDREWIARIVFESEDLDDISIMESFPEYWSLKQIEVYINDCRRELFRRALENKSEETAKKWSKAIIIHIRIEDLGSDFLMDLRKT